MKKLTFLVLLVFMSCENNDDNIQNCNFLLNVGINRTIDLNLPQFSQLQFATNSVYIANEGNLGIYVINVGGNYRAYDAADPNRQVSNCSFLSREGTSVMNSCDPPSSYSLLTGLSEGEALPCALQEYRVVANGTQLTISN